MNNNILTIKNIGVNFEGFQALENVTIKFSKNEIHALIGPNGAGKTTIIDIITGKTIPTTGNVFIGENNITGKSINDISRKFGIARKFQGANIFKDLTVYENLFVSYRKFASSNILRSFLIGPEAGKDRIKEVLDEIHLFTARNLLSSELSHGQKQWLEIGMVMVQSPQIIILDEPTAGMTIAETQKTAKLIKRLSNDFSIIVVEHDMDFIKEVADRVTVLDHGHVIAEGDYETVKLDQKVADVYLNAEN